MPIASDYDLTDFEDDPAVQSFLQGDRFVVSADDVGADEKEADEAESEE